MSDFNIPIVLFMFKRKKIVEIIKRIAILEPPKIYLIADNGRNDNEKREVKECRIIVENAINWKCEVIKNYADINRGVYLNIGLGAKWIFEKEKMAIFLEDDNLPEVTFFEYCKQMLERYENDTRILWICGTNYLGKYKTKDDVSYMFTKHLLPCGWASWGFKFNKFYDSELSLCSSEIVLSRIKNQYFNDKLYKQYSECWMNEYLRIINNRKPISWDYQMDFTIKAHGLYGICPCNNQIKNIGVDDDSIHGGNSFKQEMTRRFCGMESYPLEFPLRHPLTILPDEDFEKDS